MRNFVLPFAITLVILSILIVMLNYSSDDYADTVEPLQIYCAAGMQYPVNRIIEFYEKEQGRKIIPVYGGSGKIYTKLKAAGEGDLYLAADKSFIDTAIKEGFVLESIPVAEMQPVILVRQGNPKKIGSLKDLLRPEIKTALGSPLEASIGKMTKKFLIRAKLWQDMEKAILDRGAFKPTVNEIANDVKLGSVDAAIVWDAVAAQEEYKDLVAVKFPEAPTEQITIGILKFTRESKRALHFARYLTAPSKGGSIFNQMNYNNALNGDAWEAIPRIVYFAGSLNRLATEPSIIEFEQREGCEIEPIWLGCGLLVSRIRSGESPDVYHTCDGSFHAMVLDQFDQPTNISQTEIIIMTKKGNPKKLGTLDDLLKPNIKIGIADPAKTALGTLTKNMLEEAGIWKALNENIRETGFIAPESPMVTAQVVDGGLDAGLGYLATAHLQRDKLEMIKIDRESAGAVQTFALHKKSKHKNLMQRFLKHLQRTESQSRYTENGFSIPDKSS